MTGSIFDVCGRRLEKEERRKMARAERVGIVAAELGATPWGTNALGVDIWEMQCPHCKLQFVITAEAHLDSIATCVVADSIRRILAAAKNDCSHDMLRRMVADAKRGEE